MLERMRNLIRTVHDRPLDGNAKGSEAFEGMSLSTIARAELRIRDLPTPLMSIDANTIDYNISLMAKWCSMHDIELAPHGKTTMAPVLWQRQLSAGAWGITVSNEHQLAVALAFGVPRVHFANQVVRVEGVRRISSAIAEGTVEQVIVWADSIEAVALLARGTNTTAQIGVLVDIGASGGRTGVRSIDQARLVAQRVLATPGLTLLGVAGYEGAISEASSDRLRFEGYLSTVLAAFQSIVELIPSRLPILSIGGSIGIAETVLILRKQLAATPVRLMIRSGAYIAHDDSYYDDRREAALPLRSAISIWARVLSTPEHGLALLDAGRRDLPYDQGLPIVLGIHRGSRLVASAGVVITALNDQHAFLDTSTLPEELRIGDFVELGVSHPCTAFDRWPIVLETPVRGSPEAPIIGAFTTNF